jgi:LAO/AO transport system kinase
MHSFDLVKNIFKNDKRSVSRAITIIESGNFDSAELLKEVHKNTGNAYRIGITGPPVRENLR